MSLPQTCASLVLNECRELVKEAGGWEELAARLPPRFVGETAELIESGELARFNARRLLRERFSLTERRSA